MALGLNGQTALKHAFGKNGAIDSEYCSLNPDVLWGLYELQVEEFIDERGNLTPKGKKARKELLYESG